MLKDLFDVSRSWLVLRLLGTIFGLLYLFQIGPPLLTSEEIGGAVFVGLLEFAQLPEAASTIKPRKTLE